MQNKNWNWLANVALIISAIIVAISTTYALSKWAYTGFLIGHIIWTATSWTEKNWPLFALNACFILLDIYAISIRG